jgi:hypothetical protein
VLSLLEKQGYTRVFQRTANDDRLGHAHPSGSKPRTQCRNTGSPRTGLNEMRIVDAAAIARSPRRAFNPRKLSTGVTLSSGRGARPAPGRRSAHPLRRDPGTVARKVGWMSDDANAPALLHSDWRAWGMP